MAPSDAPSTEEVDLDTDRREVVELAAGFASGYLRWIDAATCDGLSYPRLRLLEQLHCRGPLMMRALADDLGFTPRNMTALVDALEAEGLAVRVAHPTDRRATLVQLTAHGMTAAEEALAPRMATIGELFDDLTPVDRARLHRILITLVDGLRQRGQRT